MSGLREFHNALRIMINLDMRDLERAGVIDKGDRREWDRFWSNPYIWFIQAPDPRAERLFSLIDAHQPAHLKISEPPARVDSALAAITGAP